MRRPRESKPKALRGSEWHSGNEENSKKPEDEKNKITISVIIPSNHPHSDLIKIVLKISEQSVTPNEIIIIDSSADRGKCPEEIKTKVHELGIDLLYLPEEISYPGRARNLGVAQAKTEFIAFLDVKTHPTPNWLKQAISLRNDPNLFGIWGLTNFKATTRFEKLARDGFFGITPRRTLPGTIIRKSTLSQVGRFIEWVRAGEDTDWIRRVDLQKLNFNSPSSATIDYTGLIGQRPTALAKKWWRNYTASRALPHLFPQKFLIWLLFYPTLIALAFNWNNLVADWETESIFYIPNVTKMSVLIPAVMYFAGRGLYIPYRRKVPYLELLPFRWIAIAVACLLGDAAKTIAMLSLSPNRRNDRRNSKFRA